MRAHRSCRPLARPVLAGRADQLADAILSLERFDRVAQATQFGRQ
jgi:hypothetical protein